MRSEIERATRRMLRKRREERRRCRIMNRLHDTICAVGILTSIGCLLYMEWPALVAAFHG